MKYNQLFFVQNWAFPYLNKTGKNFTVWMAEQEKEDAEPDGLTLVFMSHYISCNITVLSGKSDEWKAADDTADDIVIIYKGDNAYTHTDVGTYNFCFSFCSFVFFGFFSFIIFMCND